MTWLLMLLFLTSLFTLALTTKYRDIAYNAKEDLIKERELSIEKETAIQNKLYQVVLDSNEKITELENLVSLHRRS